MELLIALFFCLFMGTLIGYKTHVKLSIDYKQRWLQSLEIIKNEKLNTNKLKEIGPPPNLPKRLQGKYFVRSVGKDGFVGLNSEQREKMEMFRLESGLEPKDSMGGANPEAWTRVRMAQLEAGWEHWGDEGWYKIK